MIIRDGGTFACSVSADSDEVFFIDGLLEVNIAVERE
jgi:hypothetical protein